MHPRLATGRRLCFVIVCALALTACKRAAPTPTSSPSASVSTAVAAPSAPMVPAPSPLDAPQPPEGYLSAHVLRVVLTTEGSAVLLQSDSDGRVLPIFVGGTEGLSISLRHQSRRYPRPLTHDLLDSVTERLGARLVKVHVDSLSNNVFIGRVYYRQGDRAFDVDARPSDALALAISNRAPIFVASKVLDAAALRAEDLEPGDDSLPDPRTGRPDEPTQL